MSEQPSPQEQDLSPYEAQPNQRGASQPQSPENYDPNSSYQNQQLYPQDYDQGVYPPEGMIADYPMEMGNGYDGFENFPVEAIAPFNQNLEALAAMEADKKQKLKEARLREALDRQTALLDSIAQGYQKNRELRNKAELRKLKRRLETLENQKLFRDLEVTSLQAANDIAHQNNQLIFSHLNAQAQLRANPLILSLTPNAIPPFPHPSSLPPLLPMTNSLPPIRDPRFPMPMALPGGPFGPRPPWTQPMMMPGMRPPPPFLMPPGGSKSTNATPFGKRNIKLPPIRSSTKKKRRDSESSSSSSSRSRSSDSGKKKKKGKKVDVSGYLNKVFDKYKKR